MNAAPETPLDPTRLAHAQEQLRGLVDEVAELCLQNLSPPEFFRAFLGRVLTALAAPAGLLWTRTDDGQFIEQCRLNPGQLQHEILDPGAPQHAEMLRQVSQQVRPLSGLALQRDGGSVIAVPVVLRQVVVGVVQVWLGPEREPRAAAAATQFLMRLADLAALYLRQRQRPAANDLQERWNQLDAFAQRVHRSLDPTAVAFRIANEGRPLAGCDRLSVAVRAGRSATIAAISGVEHIEPRANLVRHMRALAQAVLDWGEPLVYQGTRDDSLPPAVLRALDAHLEESHGKFLIVLPLRDTLDESDRPALRSALVAECFARSLPAEQLTARLAVLGEHAASALANSTAHRQVPLRFLWQPVARLQRGLGGKTKAIGSSVALAALVLLALLVVVPYPLKMEAKGQLLPVERRWVYAPIEGQIVRFEEGVAPGSSVVQNQSLILMYDVQLETRLVLLVQEIAAAQQDVAALGKQLNVATTEAERLRLSADKQQKEALRDRKSWELRALRERTHAEESRPGHFWVKAPFAGTVLNWEFREHLTQRLVRPSEPLLRLGDQTRRWEVELKIPQKHIGQVVQALQRPGAPAELDVDLLLLSAPTRTWKGKLARTALAGEATLDSQDPTATEPVVLASVRLDGPDIPPEERLPPDLLITGTEVHAKVRCGPRAMGYSLFYGLWEYFYEKVVFFF